MRKTSFYEKTLATLVSTVLLGLLIVPAALCQDRGKNDSDYYNKRGVEFFQKGFYTHAPKNQAAEAELNYGLAIKEFGAAITRDPAHTEAHRNLGRVYYVQKNFEGAAGEYTKVTELDPADLDAYVNLALSFIELKELDKAIEVLENAKAHTSDAKALNALDTYIKRVLTLKARG